MLTWHNPLALPVSVTRTVESSLASEQNIDRCSQSEIVFCIALTTSKSQLFDVISNVLKAVLTDCVQVGLLQSPERQRQCSINARLNMSDVSQGIRCIEY
jgi:hypothetical protein